MCFYLINYDLTLPCTAFIINNDLKSLQLLNNLFGSFLFSKFNADLANHRNCDIAGQETDRKSDYPCAHPTDGKARNYCTGVRALIYRACMNCIYTKGDTASYEGGF